MHNEAGNEFEFGGFLCGVRARPGHEWYVLMHQSSELLKPLEDRCFVDEKVITPFVVLGRHACTTNKMLTEGMPGNGVWGCMATYSSLFLKTVSSSQATTDRFVCPSKGLAGDSEVACLKVPPELGFSVGDPIEPYCYHCLFNGLLPWCAYRKVSGNVHNSITMDVVTPHEVKTIGTDEPDGCPFVLASVDEADIVAWFGDADEAPEGAVLVGKDVDPWIGYRDVEGHVREDATIDVRQLWYTLHSMAFPTVKVTRADGRRWVEVTRMDLLDAASAPALTRQHEMVLIRGMRRPHRARHRVAAKVAKDVVDWCTGNDGNERCWFAAELPAIDNRRTRLIKYPVQLCVARV